MPLNEYEMIAVIAVALVSLFIGSVSDVKKRTVKSYLFIPLIATGSVIDYLVSAPAVFIVLTVIVFIATFLRTDISLLQNIQIRFSSYPLVKFLCSVS